jgi:hypothetical protein
MKALNPISQMNNTQTENPIEILGRPNDQTWIFPEPINLPEIPVLMLDTGKSPDNGNKIAMFRDSRTLNIKKVPCNLNKKPGHIVQSDPSDFFAEQYSDPDASFLEFEMDGVVYTAGNLAADENAGVGLGLDKFVDIKPRVTSALALFGITGPFALCLTATYENLEHFQYQSRQMENALLGGFNWTTISGSFSAQIFKQDTGDDNPAKKGLFTIPESSESWQFPKLFAQDKKLSLEGKPNVTVELGFQTTNYMFRKAGATAPAPALSGADKELGGNLFYADIAQRIGANNPQSPELINAINRGDASIYLPELGQKIALLSVVNAAKPSFETRYIDSILKNMRSEYRIVTLSGGMVYLFGPAIKQALEQKGFEVRLIPQFPELAQIVSMSVMAVNRFYRMFN